MATSTNTPVKKTTVAKKAPAKKVAAPKAEPVKASKQRRTDEEIIAILEEQWAKGFHTPHTMSEATRGTANFIGGIRVRELAKKVIAAHGGAPAKARKAEKKSGSLDTVTAMKAEHESLKAWRANGMKGDSPATPTLDKRNAALKAKSDATTKALAEKKAIASVKKGAAKK